MASPVDAISVVRFDLRSPCSSPASNAPEMLALYQSGCARLGTTPLLLRRGSGEMIWMARDLDRACQGLSPHLLHDAVSDAGRQREDMSRSAVTSAARSATSPGAAMSSQSALLRLARPEELALLVEIDDDAGQLYAEAGLRIELEPAHPFLVAEQERWRSALAQDGVFLAVDDRDRGLGFAALGTLGTPGGDEAAPYLDQLSVRRAAMGQGIGRRLLRRAIASAEGMGAQRGSARDGWLWLTTYGHLRWNRPFYESEGFEVVAESEWPREVARHIDEQRACLPDPEQRIAMRRPL